MTQFPLERAARALYRTGDFDHNQLGEDEIWPDLVDYARAVLMAIREPIEAMVAVGGVHAADTPPISEEGNVAAIAVWQAMIDAAMEEG